MIACPHRGQGGTGRLLPESLLVAFTLALAAPASAQSDEWAVLGGEQVAGPSAAAYEAVALDPSALNAVQVFPDEVFTDLDYGLYWYGYDEGAASGRYVKASEADNPFYDPSRPTVIHIHGWQNGSIAAFFRTDYDHRRHSSGDVDKDVASPWLDQGYNVGMLYWTNFADEGQVTHAEAKIWSPNGPRGMKYRVRKSADPNNGSTEQRDFEGAPDATVGSLLADAIVDGMADFSGPSFRLTGHSLGNQVAIAIAGDIHARLESGQISNEKLLPTRIALLDPYYTGSRISGLSERTERLAVQIMETLLASEQGQAPVVFEAYRSSALAIRNGSAVLERGNAAIVSLKPHYYGWFDFAKKHQVAWWWYFWGMEFAVPTTGDGASGLSASASPQQVEAQMDSTRFLDQQGGSTARTKSPEDDGFTLKNR